MKTKFLVSFLFLNIYLLTAAPVIFSKDAEFSAVVKTIEAHYHVKSRGIPKLAKMGMKAAAHVKRFSEYGSVSVAIFEDQNFTAPSGSAGFSSALKNVLFPSWQLLLETYSKQSEETFVFTKESGERFKVLVVAIGSRDGTVVQAEISPNNLALLLKEPETMAKTLTDESTSDGEPD